MKNASIALNAALLVAVAILYYLHFKSPSAAASPAKKQETPATASSAGAEQSIIAYVNQDTLNARYLLHKEMINALEERQKKADNDMKNRMMAFEKEMQDAQAKAQTLSPNQLQDLQMKLAKKENDIRAFGEETSKKIMQDQEAKNNEYTSKVREFLKEYVKDKPYRIVFGYTQNAMIYYGDPALDITNDVVEGLNAAHKTAKK
jgi:outer membrane protein